MTRLSREEQEPLTFSAYSEAICLISSDCRPTMWPTALAVSRPCQRTTATPPQFKPIPSQLQDDPTTAGQSLAELPYLLADHGRHVGHQRFNPLLNK